MQHNLASTPMDREKTNPVLLEVSAARALRDPPRNCCGKTDIGFSCDLEVGDSLTKGLFDAIQLEFNGYNPLVERKPSVHRLIRVPARPYNEVPRDKPVQFVAELLGSEPILKLALKAGERDECFVFNVRDSVQKG